MAVRRFTGGKWQLVWPVHCDCQQVEQGQTGAISSDHELGEAYFTPSLNQPMTNIVCCTPFVYAKCLFLIISDKQSCRCSNTSQEPTNTYLCHHSKPAIGLLVPPLMMLVRPGFLVVQQAPHALAALKFPETIDLVVRVGDTGKGMHGVIAHLPILESCGSGKK